MGMLPRPRYSALAVAVDVYSRQQRRRPRDGSRGDSTACAVCLGQPTYAKIAVKVVVHDVKISLDRQLRRLLALP
jgi:hypothetical protein